MIRILVDSASDITLDNADNIVVVPLSVNINNKTYLDQVELGHSEFYELLEQTETFPKTSQPSPQLFVEAYEKIKEDQDEVICILLSSGVSGTYQSSILAREIVGYDKIYSVDSLTGAYGVKILADEALKCIKEGMNALDIVDHLNELKKRVQVYVCPETLEYLYKGGRLSKASAVVGSIAKVKPIIEVTREGKVEAVNKAIGMNKAMNKTIEMIEEQGIDTSYPFYTIHTKGVKNVEKFESKLKEAGIEVSDREQLGPVVGTHLGAEAFGAIFVMK